MILDRFQTLGKDAELDSHKFADQLEQEVLQPWAAMSEQFPPLSELPAKQQSRPIVPRIYHYLTVRQESFKLLLQAVRADDDELLRRAKEKLAEADAAAAAVKP